MRATRRRPHTDQHRVATRMRFVIRAHTATHRPLWAAVRSHPRTTLTAGYPEADAPPLRATLYGLSEGGFVILFVILPGIKCAAPLWCATIRPNMALMLRLQRRASLASV